MEITSSAFKEHFQKFRAFHSKFRFYVHANVLLYPINNACLTFKMGDGKDFLKQCTSSMSLSMLLHHFLAHTSTLLT